MRNEELIVYNDPKSPISEAFRTIRTNIQFSNIDKGIKSLVLTSSGPSEGKSTVISNLAITMAQAGKKVLLIDSDLRKPRIHKIFALNSYKGLTNVIFYDLDYKEVIKFTPVDGLDILTSGPIPPNPAEILGSEKMKKFLKNVEEDYDLVLIDTPPIGVVTDAAVLASRCDGVILVCAVGQAIIDAVKNAKNALEKVNANILGVVLNKVPMGKRGYYKYYYYQSYYEDEDTRKKGRRKKDKRGGI